MLCRRPHTGGELLYDAEISPEQGASKIVKISQHVASYVEN